MSQRRDNHDRHEPYEWHEPTHRPTPAEDGQEHEQQAGNGTVNHGPDANGPHPQGPDVQGSDALGSDALGPDALGPDVQGSDALGSDALGSDGFGSDELALRRLLHQAVQEIEPTDGTLEHLRRAVPARRARKRQAIVGVAAAALFIGTAVPALVHVSNASGSNADPSIAGNSSQAQGGTSQGKGPDGGESSAGGSSGTSKDKGKGSQTGTPDKGKGTNTGSATSGPDPSASAVISPACTPAQLGGATSAVGTPDATGAVYGSFTLSNVSATSCTVSGAGAVGTLAQGAADSAKISVVTHVAGDAATGLPDPSTEVASVVLKPSASYVVKFAWVPSETCPTTGGGQPSPTPTTTTDGATSTGGTATDTGGTGTSTQMVTEDGGLADGSVTVSYTAETGAATATTTVSNACAGTIYRTGMLPAS
ncbi:hypothetical protein ABZ656_50610 [Streptomyces sp. NPDC007095]|jgi:hypothetical protein|uniref:hypothetical protein n=1 Tax=Streptomyces sp. NPDC007095 TaxID=3154482 RepID=UPI0033F704A4